MEDHRQDQEQPAATISPADNTQAASELPDVSPAADPQPSDLPTAAPSSDAAPKDRPPPSTSKKKKAERAKDLAPPSRQLPARIGRPQKPLKDQSGVKHAEDQSPAKRGRGGRGRGRSQGRGMSQLAHARQSVQSAALHGVRGRGRERGRGRGRGRSKLQASSDDEASPVEELDDEEASEQGQDGMDITDAEAAGALKPPLPNGFSPVHLAEREPQAAAEEHGTQEAAEEAAEAAAEEAAVQPQAAKGPDPVPELVLVPRPGGTNLQFPSSAMGDAMAAYMILRAFSWQLRLSPVPFPELCAAILSSDPTPLADDVHICLLRALALDEPKAVRAARTLDLGLLDAVTWPEFMWEWLRDAGDPLESWRDWRREAAEEPTAQEGSTAAAGSEPADAAGASTSAAADRQPQEAAQQAPADTEKQAEADEAAGEAPRRSARQSLGVKSHKWAGGNDEDAADQAGAGKGRAAAGKLQPAFRGAGGLQRSLFCRRPPADYWGLPAHVKAAVLAALCDGLLGTHMVRGEINAREERGMWAAGPGGVGGAFPMRSRESREKRAAAAENGDEGGGAAPVPEEDGNVDGCVLCHMGGSLLCCDACPAAYHMRCIGESNKSLPPGEWLCPECALGGRGESAGLRVPALDRACTSVVAHAALYRMDTEQVAHDPSYFDVGELLNAPMDRSSGEASVEALKGVKLKRKGQKAQAAALASLQGEAAALTGLPTATAELYLNCYRNAWGAMTVAAKQAYDDAVRRRGRPAAGRPAIPLSELAVPLPLSRFLWPSSQGRGIAQKGAVKCGKCPPCLRPSMRKACLRPLLPTDAVDNMSSPSKLSMVVMWCKKAERELWGLLEAGWEGAGFGSYRNLWSLQLQPGCTVARAAGALLQLEAALRRIAVNPQWDAASSQGEASSPQGTPEGSAEPPGELRRSRGLRQGEDGEADRIVDYVGMKKPGGWTVNIRGQWARQLGRLSLPQALAKRSARRGSNLRIQGVAYNSKLASQDAHQQWRAATEQSLTAAQLAVQLRALDAAILWDALKTPGSLGDSKWGRAELLSKRRDPSGRSWEYQLHIRPLNPPPVAAEGLGSSAETAKAVSGLLASLAPLSQTPQGANAPQKALPKAPTIVLTSTPAAQAAMPSPEAHVPSTAPADTAAGATTAEQQPQEAALAPTAGADTVVVSGAAGEEAAAARQLPSAQPAPDVTAMPEQSRSATPPEELAACAEAPADQLATGTLSAAAAEAAVAGFMLPAAAPGSQPEQQAAKQNSADVEMQDASQQPEQDIIDQAEMRNADMAMPESQPAAAEQQPKEAAEPGAAAAGSSKPVQAPSVSVTASAHVPASAMEAARQGSSSPAEQAVVPAEDQAEAAHTPPADDSSAPAADGSVPAHQQPALPARPNESLPADRDDSVPAGHDESPTLAAVRQSQQLQEAAAEATGSVSHPQDLPAPGHSQAGSTVRVSFIFEQEDTVRVFLHVQAAADKADAAVQRMSRRLKGERGLREASATPGDLRHSSREASQDGASPEQWAVASQKWAELYRWVPPGGLPHVPPTIGWEEEGFWPELPEDEQRYSAQPAAGISLTPLLPLKLPLGKQLQTSKHSSKPSTKAARAASPALHVPPAAAKLPPGEVSWVSEARLPLWLIKGYEENAKRAALVAAAEAQREAAKENARAKAAAARAQAAAAAAARGKDRDRAASEAGSAAAAAAEAGAGADAEDACVLCGQVYGEDPAKDELWIACDDCNRWYHGNCAGATVETVGALQEDAVWECPECEMKRTERQKHKGMRQRRAPALPTAATPSAAAAPSGKKSRKAAAASAGPCKPGREGAAGRRSRGPVELSNLAPRENRRAQEEEAKLPEVVYCVCRQADDPNRAFIECEDCQEWFHPECVGTTLQAAQEQAKWMCPACTLKAPAQEEAAAAQEQVPLARARGRRMKNTGTAPAPSSTSGPAAAQAPPEPIAQLLDDSWRREAARAITMAARTPAAIPFLEPVSAAEVPDYHLVVAKPMDLGTARANIRSGVYPTPGHAWADLELIWSNCRAYNAPGSQIWAAGETVQAALANEWLARELPMQLPGDPTSGFTAAAQLPDGIPTGVPTGGRSSRRQMAAPETEAPTAAPTRGRPSRLGSAAAPSQDPAELPAPLKLKLHLKKREQQAAAASLEGSRKPQAGAEPARREREVSGRSNKRKRGAKELQEAAEPSQTGAAPTAGVSAQMAAAYKIVVKVARSTAGKPFAMAISDDIVPGYSSIIHRPMDLTTIAERISQHVYPSIEAVWGDVELVWANCRSFNAAASPICKLCSDAESNALRKWVAADLPGPTREAAESARAAIDSARAPAAETGNGPQQQKRKKKKTNDAALGNPSAAGAEPSRKRKRPHEAAQDASQRPGSGKGKKAGMSKEQRKAAASVLQEVTQSKHGAPFAAPVSEEAVPGYHTVIRQPMDLGTVAGKLQQRAYPSVEELLADVELVWANCRQFNTEASPIDKACTKAQRLLQKLWHRAKLPGSAPTAAAAVASQPATEAAGPSTGEPGLKSKRKQKGKDKPQEAAGPSQPAGTPAEERRPIKVKLKAFKRTPSAPAPAEAGPADAQEAAGGAAQLAPEKRRSKARRAAQPAEEVPAAEPASHTGRKAKHKASGRFAASAAQSPSKAARHTAPAESAQLADGSEPAAKQRRRGRQQAAAAEEVPAEAAEQPAGKKRKSRHHTAPPTEEATPAPQQQHTPAARQAGKRKSSRSLQAPEQPAAVAAEQAGAAPRKGKRGRLADDQLQQDAAEQQLPVADTGPAAASPKGRQKGRRDAQLPAPPTAKPAASKRKHAERESEVTQSSKRARASQAVAAAPAGAPGAASREGKASKKTRAGRSAEASAASEPQQTGSKPAKGKPPLAPGSPGSRPTSAKEAAGRAAASSPARASAAAGRGAAAKPAPVQSSVSPKSKKRKLASGVQADTARNGRSKGKDEKVQAGKPSSGRSSRHSTRSASAQPEARHSSRTAEAVKGSGAQPAAKLAKQPSDAGKKPGKRK